MRTAAAALSILALMLALGPGQAQVISGESTYGDNFLHDPPADTTAPTRRETPAPDDRDGQHDGARRAEDGH